MYVRYPKLSDDNLATLEELVRELNWVASISHRRRMGENLQDNLSQYTNTRWFKWTHEQRQRFRSAIPENQHSKALVGYFIEFAPKTGLLDRMTTWKDDPANSGTIIAYALKDGVILLNDTEVDVKRGEGIGFNLSVIHEIKPSDNGQLWANLMVMGDPAKFKV